jgi:hypothetical protein
MWARALAVWLLIMAAESAQGALRQLYLAPALGDMRARQIGVFTGIAIIAAITWLLIGWVRPQGARSLLGIGALWVLSTVVFELSLGRQFGFTWSRILADYDPRAGGLMMIGLLAMLCLPWAMARLRGLC